MIDKEGLCPEEHISHYREHTIKSCAACIFSNGGDSGVYWCKKHKWDNGRFSTAVSPLGVCNDFSLNINDLAVLEPFDECQKDCSMMRLAAA